MQSHPKESIIYIKVPNSAWHIVGAILFLLKETTWMSDQRRKST